MAELNKAILDAIRYATRMEIQGRSFYEHVAGVTKSDHGKAVFKKLAQDENGHIEQFSEIFTSVLGSDEWKTYIDKEELEKQTVLDELKARVEKRGKEEKATDLEALRIGLELERGAIDYYTKQVDTSNDVVVKDLFSRITKEEQYHYDLLQAQYDNITGSGFWFDMAEFKMDGRF
ncbi:ferritin family protein [candidate division WOR-3 bacterium]|nr:ferritin family protein [candidate division WOR-3 bacterium]